MHINDLYNFFDNLYPFKTAESFDNSGYVYKAEKSDVKIALLCLDITTDAVNKAKEVGADIIISHHPLVFEGIKQFDCTKDAVLAALIKNGISAISLHTNFDAAEGGINDNLAKILGLENIQGISSSNGGKYSGVIGSFSTTSFNEIANNIKNALDVPTLRAFDTGKPILKAAIVGGAGFSFFDDVVSTGADLFITGECKYHYYIKAKQYGISLIDAGHFYTERIFGEILEKALAETDISVYKYSDKLYYKEI